MSTSTSVLGLIHEEHMLFLSLFFSPNNCLENVSLSDQSMASNPRKGQAKCPGAKATSHDGRAGHVMTHMCHPRKARRMASVTIQVPTQGICTPATGIALWPAKLPSQAMSS